MYKLLLLFVCLSSVHATELCPIQSQGDAITKLAKELEASCDWSIKELARQSLIRDCKNAQKSDPDIRLKTENGKTEVRFTMFGNTFDQRTLNVECKHKLAYDFQLNQIIQKLEQEAYAAQRANYESTPKKPSNHTYSESTQPKKKKLWSCRVPGYIRTYRIVDESEKQILESAHNTVCTPYN